MKFLGVSIILSTIIALLSISQILPWTMNSYNKYIQTIRSYIPDDTRTLANLNSSFAFAYGDLYSYRDLIVLNKNNDFREYIDKHKIEYIVYPHELEIIFNERPVWNTMYGNIYPWYEEMMFFLTNECEEISSWNEPVFGMRITSYMGSRDGNITVYRVLGDK